MAEDAEIQRRLSQQRNNIKRHRVRDVAAFEQKLNKRNIIIETARCEGAVGASEKAGLYAHFHALRSVADLQNA